MNASLFPIERDIDRAHQRCHQKDGCNFERQDIGIR